MLQNRGVMYYYITNLQGDVIRLVNSSGQTAAYYEYDPYGNAITAAGSHCEINPLRYRGYVYDTETGLYYCQSRYYDPEIGRFINADSFASTGQGAIGYNMFSYCNSNPVNCVDVAGAMCVPTEDLGGSSPKVFQVAEVENIDNTTIALTYGNYCSLTIGMYNISQNTEFSFDLKGNIQVNSSWSFDVTTAGSPSASMGHSGSIFFVPDTSYLAGGTSYLGTSVSAPVVVVPIDITGSANVGQTTDGYWGLMFSVGVAPPSLGGPEVHGGYSHTFALTPQINLIDIFSLQAK